MPLNETEFMTLCSELGLKSKQEEWSTKRQITVNSVFDTKKGNLWQTYNEYKKLLKNVYPDKQNDKKLLDPHKVASCLVLAVLICRAFELETDNTMATNDISNIPKDTITPQMFLLNELFAIHCGIRYLKYAMIQSNDDENIKVKISKFTIKNIPVNRYDDDANETYIDYIAYNLRYLWETIIMAKTKNEKFKLSDVRNLAGVFHHIENYCYSEIESSSKVKLCPSCATKLINNTIDKTISTDSHILCEECHQTMRQTLNSTSSN